MPKIEILKQNGYHFLWIDNDLWMWDLPCEVIAQKMIADQAYGDVLVAGYGLGIVQKFLVSNDNVNLLWTVEQYADVIKEAKKTYGTTYGSIIEEDFHHFNPDRKFDCVIGDVWAEIMPQYLQEYKKFKEQAYKFLKPEGKILSWGGDYFEYLLNHNIT